MLGIGPYSEVRVCKNIKTLVYRAVKLIKKETLDPSETQRIIHEIEILKRLDHP
jgi:serine/threonine protein kinase